jgi:hypothetical protein
MNGLEKNMCHHYWSFKRFGQADYRIEHAAAGLIKEPRFQVREIMGENREEFRLSISSEVEGKAKKTFVPAEIIDQSGMTIQNRSSMQLKIQTDSYIISDINSAYPERVRELIYAACQGNMNWPQLRFKDRGVSVIINAPFDNFRDGRSVKMNHVALFVGRISNPNNVSAELNNAGVDLPHYAARMIFSNFSEDELTNAFPKISDRSSISPLSQLSFHLMAGRKDYLPPQVS